MKKTLVFALVLAVALSSCFIIPVPAGNTAKAVVPLQWTQVNNGFADGQHGVSSLAIDPWNTEIVYAGKNFDGVCKTTNGGSLWTSMNSGLTDFYVRSVAIDPLHALVVYVGTNTFVFKSTDGGIQWNAMDNGLVNKNVSSIAIDSTDTDVVYAATTNGGVYKSQNGGSLWTQRNIGLTTSNVFCLAIAPSDHDVVYVAAGSKGVFKSTNGGGSWTITGLTYAYANNSYLRSLAIDPTDAEVLYSGAENGWVYKSIDGGSSWTHSGVVPGSTPDILSLVIDPTNTQVVYAGASIATNIGGVYMSTDGGISWTTAGLTKPYVRCLTMDPTNSQVIYAGTTYDGVFKSTATLPAAELVFSPSWNLVSVAYPLPVASIPGLQAVYGYHDGWSAPPTLLLGGGYWVQVQNAVTIPLPGTPSTAPVSLPYLAGWQLLGNPFDVPLPISSNITNHEYITTCYSYDSGWGILNPATDSLQPGRGYWIYLTTATTLMLTYP
ncbi:MAG TPA: hypothetical protein VF370_03640 [Candidatus Cryosericum sp.]